MNKHLHRVVFNKRRGQLMAVAEIAASDGKAAGVTELPAQSRQAIGGPVIATLRASACGVLLSLAAVLVLMQPAHAQISADAAAPGNQRPTVLAAPNGVPLVNIQTPSAAGVSRNTYSQFDVDGGGAILNNSRTNTQTQLGGWVQGNPWLATGPARVILNEVNSANPSQLRGYMEVAGQRAEVIIANPAGIQVNGGGFINASGVTLTTGTPVMNAGSLEGFRVQRGQVDIQGLGLDARTADFTTIYARALQVNAGVWASNLAAVTGANQVAPGVAGAVPQVTAIAGSTAAPAFALDVGALGGMYAGKIHLIGTEAGLGVNMQGALAANAGSLVLQADGQLTNTGTIASTAGGQDVTIRTQGLVNSGTLASQNNVALEVGSGAIGNSGTVNAARELIASAGEITNRGTFTAGRLQLAATSLTNTGGRIEQSGSQALAIKAQSVSNIGAAALIGAPVAAMSGGGGADGTGTGGSGGGTQSPAPSDPQPPSTSTGGGSTQMVVVPPPPAPMADGSMQVGTLVNADGQIVANGATALASTQSLTNSGSIHVQNLSARGAVNNSGGTLYANNLDIEVSTLSNRNASIGTDGDLSLRSGALDNSSGQINAAGNLSIDTGAFANAAGSAQAGATLTINAADIDNAQGTLYAGADASVTATGAVTSSGSVAAGRHLAITAQSIDSTGTLVAGVAHDGALGSAGDLRIATTGGLRAVGTNLAARSATLQGASVDLAGSTTSAANLSVQATAGDIRTRAATITTPGQLTLTAAQAVDNTGGRIDAQTLAIDATSLDNSGGQIAQTGATGARIALSQQLANVQGTIQFNATDASIQAGGMSNTAGRLEHAGAGTLALTTGDLTNGGVIASNGHAQVQAANLVQAGGTLSAQQLTVHAQGLDNRQGSIVHGGAGTASIGVDGALDNAAGRIQSNGALALSAGGLSNRAGQIATAAGAALDLAVVQALDNTDGAIASGAALNLQAGGIDNTRGQVAAAGRIDASTAGALNNQSGQMAAGGAMSLRAADLNNQTGFIAAQGALQVQAQALNNTQGNISAAALDLQAANLLANAQGQISAASDLVLRTAGALDNAGGTVAAQGALQVQAQSVDNALGTLYGHAGLDLAAQAVSSSGTIASGHDARIQAALANTGLVQAASNLELSGSVSNTGRLIAAGAATLTGALANSGLVQAGTALNIDTQSAALVNNGSQGIVSGGQLTIHAGQLSNTDAAIAAEGALQIQAPELRNTGGTLYGRAGLDVAATSLDNTGTVASGGDAQIRADLTNRGALQASGDLALMGRVDNAGQVLAGRSASLQGQLTNSGLVQAATTLTVDTQGAVLVNTGTQGLLSGGALSVNAGEINNTAGNMRAGAALNLHASGAVNNQAGLIASDAAVTISSQGLDNTAGLVQATGDLSIDTGAQLLANVNTALDKGLVAGGALTITANSLDNTSGRIAAVGSGSVNLQMAGNIDNTSGVISGNNDVTLSAAGLANGNGSLSAGRDLAVSAGSLSQPGQLRAGRDLAIAVGSSLTLDGDNLAASRDLLLTVSGDLANSGKQTAAGNLTLFASGAITNNADLSTGQTLVASAGNNLVNIGSIVGGTTILSAGQLVANRGPSALIGATDTAGTLAILAPVIENSDDVTATDGAPSTTILGLGNVVLAGGWDAQGTLTQATQITNRSALIESGGDMAVAAATVTNTRRQLVVSSSFDTPLTQPEADAMGISLSGRVGSPNMPDPNQIGGVYIDPPHSGSMNSDYLWTDYTGVAARRPVVAISPKAQIIVGGNLDASAVGVLQNYWSDISAAGSIALGAAQVDQDSWRGAAQPLIQVNYSGTYQYRTYKGAMWTLAFADDLRYYSSPANYDSTLTAGGTISGNGGSLTNGSQGAGALPTGGRTQAGGTLVTASAQGTRYQQPTAVNSPAANAAAQPGAPGQASAGFVSSASASSPGPAAPINPTSGARPAAMQVSPSALYHVAPSPASGYYVETDARFTDYRQWLGSDYLLQALGIDPAQMDKRLGDGFYEQRLVREQLMELTGKRFLGDYRSEDEQYKALMNNAVTAASAFDLRPGLALTREQMAQLTSDIVWLVEQEVILPDGSRVRALVPQVYLAAASTQLRPDGALVAAHSIDLRNQQNVVNGGTISAQDGLVLQSLADINSRLGTISAGGAMQLAAAQDIDLTGAQLKAASLKMSAGRDLIVVSATATRDSQTLGITRSDTRIVRTASMEVAGDAQLSVGRDVQQAGADIRVGGNLVAAVGRDWVIGAVQEQQTVSAARVGGQASGEFVSNRSSKLDVGGDTAIHTGGDFRATAAQLQLGASEQNTASIRAEGDLVLDAARDSQHVQQTSRTKDNAGATMTHDEQVRGTSVNAGGSLVLSAGRDVVARAATVQAEGSLAVGAGRDIVVGTAQETHSYAMQDSGTHKGLLNSKTVKQTQSMEAQLQVGSSFGGSHVSIAAGRDVTVTGSSVVSDEGTAIYGARNVTVEAASNLTTQDASREERTSGLFTSGLSVTLGQRTIAQQQSSRSTSAVASTIGSVAGNVSIAAGEQYRQVGSDVLAPAGDITLAAKKVDIVEARQTEQATSQTHASQSGVTLAVSTPVLSAIQTAAQMQQAASHTSDSRMKALAAGTAALSAKNAADAVAADPKSGGGINLSISIGASRSDSKTEQASDSARGSTVAAGGNTTITASGDGAASTILVQGSDIVAGGKAALAADGAVTLQAAQNTASLHGSNSASSASVGISIGTSGFGVTASASAGRGHEAGDDLVYTNTRVRGQQVQISSGGDTTLKGAVVSGDQVSAQVGGNLKIESLQDVSTYDSKQQNVGGSVTIGAGGSASFSYSQSKVNSDYRNVAEQSGIKAGDGGFQVDVAGATDLKGGLIASTDKAVQDGANSFRSAGGVTSSDIENAAHYKAESISVGVGTRFQPGAGSGLSGAGFGSDSGNASSVTRAGISAIAGDTAVRSTDAQTGIGRIFDKDKVRQEVDAQAQITQAFGSAAAKAVGDYASGKFNQLSEQARNETDPDQKKALEAEADKWAEGGAYRVGLHTVVGGLTGGVSGSLGAAVAAGTADRLNEATTSLAQQLETGGLSPTAAETLSQLITGGVATTLGAVAGGPAGATAALNTDFDNRQLHTQERNLIEKLAKEKALLQCSGDAQCESKATIGWADALERSAKGLVDDQEYAKNMAYLQALVQASIDPNSEGARGALQAYVSQLQEAQAMLMPYMGQPITVNGVAVPGDGSAQMYFSATAAQRANPRTNYVLGLEPPSAIVPGVKLRDLDRVERFGAQNGTAQPVYPIEELVLGTAVGNRGMALVGRWWESLDVALAGKAGASQSGNLSTRQITEEGISLTLTNSERAILSQLEKLTSTNLQGEVREYVADSYFVRNGFTPLQGKCGSGNCFDGVYLKDGKIYINEVKPLNENGSIKLSGENPNTELATQMSDKWVDGAISRLRESGDPAAIRTANLIKAAKDNKTLVKLVTGVDNRGATVVKLRGDGG